MVQRIKSCQENLFRYFSRYCHFFTLVVVHPQIALFLFAMTLSDCWCNRKLPTSTRQKFKTFKNQTFGRHNKGIIRMFRYNTRRDGEQQSPGASMNVEEKDGSQKQLVKVRRRNVIEAGFPISSPDG